MIIHEWFCLPSRLHRLQGLQDYLQLVICQSVLCCSRTCHDYLVRWPRFAMHAKLQGALAPITSHCYHHMRMDFAEADVEDKPCSWGSFVRGIWIHEGGLLQEALTAIPRGSKRCTLKRPLNPFVLQQLRPIWRFWVEMEVKNFLQLPPLQGPPLHAKRLSTAACRVQAPSRHAQMQECCIGKKIEHGPVVLMISSTCMAMQVPQA